MDNVTHSLAGLLIAEAAGRLRARDGRGELSPRIRTVAALSSMVAANLPDADLFYTGVGGDRLAYMLHHRGHTHTVVIALLGAVLLWGAAWLVVRPRVGVTRADRSADSGYARWLLALLVVSTSSHLVLDWTNSYGVHPFWPFDDRWYYGDAVFIVEPWFWAVSVPALVAASGRRVARVLLSLVLLAGLVLVWRVNLVSRGAAAAVTLGAVASIALARRLAPGARAATAVGAWIVVTLVMSAGSRGAEARVRTAARAASPGVELLDVVVSPLPTHPLCVNAITVERSGTTYRAVTARASALPSLVDAATCGSRSAPGNAPSPSSRASSRAVRWDAEWTAPHAELAALARESCVALAALRFIRVPAWRTIDDSTVMLGDMRFGASGRGFSDVRVPRRAASCPPRVPPWTPPRAELLRP